ncbi:proline--tRNA ligase [Buchnera aphidicola (Mindarus keteleerifoliae)]|uniref:proline--tRNA ligase n=1 Tax=Buchnera aphidicola TaxID=9 RepID=UPI0031B728C0
MQTTKYILSTMRETPSESEMISHQLMLKSGMIRKISSGIYTWLPTGLRVINQIKKIIRKEMLKIDGIEFSMPILQPENLWKKSKRLDQYGKELFKTLDRNQKTFILGPTHEELITKIIKHEIHSYKQLPIILFQIQTKFRDEIRPCFGTIRSREFIMKDAYSFHTSSSSLKKTYETLFKTYMSIFKKIGIDVIPVKAKCESMGGTESHEFQVLSKLEKNIFKSSNEIKNSSYSTSEKKKNIKPIFFNAKNIANKNTTLNKKNLFKKCKTIEIAHIFKLEKKYSHTFGFKIQKKNGSSTFLKMGCYGIGISRLIAAIIEQNHDSKGIIWNKSIAPFQIAILPINLKNSFEIQKITFFIYEKLKKEHINILLDDRNEQIGAMFADMELIGIPFFIIISERHLKKNSVEYRERKNNVSCIIPIEKIFSFIKNKLL